MSNVDFDFGFTAVTEEELDVVIEAKETAVMKKMRTIVNSTNNYDIKAVYKELCEKFKNYQ